MKTMRFIALTFFLASPIFIFSNFRPKATPAFQSVLHADPALNRLRLEVSKPAGTPLTVRVLDRQGWVLHQQHGPTAPTRVQIGYNLCALPHGLYYVEVSGPHGLQTRQVRLTPATNPHSARLIEVQAAD